MALILPTTNKVQIVRLTKALFDAAPGYTYLSAFEGAVAEMGTGTAGMNAFANWLSSVVSTNPATLTATMVASLHLTGATATAFTAFFTSAFASVTPAQYGQTILAGLNGLANIPSTDATWGATANAFNTSVANSYVFSTNTANTTVDLPTLLAADEVNPLSPAITLTTAFDNLLGTANPDSFYAYIRDNANTLQSGDKIDGGAGVDVLWADMGTSSAFAVTPETVSVEEIRIRAEAVPGDSKDGNNMTQNVQIDAQRMAGVTLWASDNSRSDVIIEDVRINSNISTIEFKESDPGNVDLGVYFNQRNLVNTTGGSSSLNIMVMDTYAAGTAATAATPLLALNFNAYSYYAVPTGGTAQLIILGGAGTAAGTAMLAAKTYTAMQAAFQLALQTASVNGVITDLSSSVTVNLGALTNFTTLAAASPTSAPVAASFLNLSGQVITMTTSVPGITISTTGAPGSPAAGWIAAGPAPITGSIVQTYSTGQTDSVALVNTNIILDDVGMGSTGGDLLVGGMSTGDTSTSKGVERFNITVKDNSKVQTINSTDNTLREVVIVNGATSSESTAYVTTTKDAGNLTVNGNAKNSLGADQGNSVTDSKNQEMAGANEGATAVHQGANAAGFTDVRLIDGSQMTGKLAFTAAITNDSIAKYINLVDVAANPLADVAVNNVRGLGANFDYKGGGNGDTMVVTIDAAAVASRSTVVSGMTDFTFNIDGGAGDDAITVNVNTSSNLNGNLQNWAANQDLNDNIKITGGAGNDTIRIPGAGDTVIDAGAGNDTIYTDNTGAQTGLIFATNTAPIGGTPDKGVWVFNTMDQVNAAANGAARNLADLRSSDNTTYNLYKGQLTVQFKGIISAKVDLLNPTTTVTQNNTTVDSKYLTSDLEINQAIKNAINNDTALNKLLVAEDGPGNTLVVKSLIDGTMTTADLSVKLYRPVGTTTFTADELAGMKAAFTGGAGIVTSADAIALMIADNSTPADYTVALAQDAANVNITGAASTSTSDNYITPGTENDVIVLGTTVGTDVARSSNEVIILDGLFGNDVVVNFATGGTGIDHFDVSSYIGSGTPTVSTVALAATTDKLITIVTETAALDTAAEIKTLVDGFAQPAATTKQLYIAVNATDASKAKIYSIVNGTAAADAVVTEQGTIDLGDSSAWATLTAANFKAPTNAQTEGSSSANLTLGSVQTAVAANQLLMGTNFIDQLSTGGQTGVTMTGLADNDLFTVTAGSIGAVITDLATGDSFTVAGANAGAAVNASGALTATVAGNFAATSNTVNNATINNAGGTTLTYDNTKVVLTAGAAGFTIDMGLATGLTGYTLNGEGGINTLKGSNAADIISGLGGVDNLYGNGGNDIFKFAAASGAATIDGGTGYDTIECTGTQSFTTATISNIEAVKIDMAGAGAQAVTFDGSQITGTSWKITGNVAGGADSLVVTALAASTVTLANVIVDTASVTTVTLNGSAGIDTLTGAATATVINGLVGNDIITGGAGNDTITGGAGNDTLTGNGGADIFRFDTIATALTAANSDKITDFTTTVDKINLTGNGGAGALLAGVTITAGTTTAAAVGANVVDATSVADLAAVYTAIAANAAFGGAWAGSTAGAGAGQIASKTISFAAGAAAGTYLVVNDVTAGFVAADDLVIQIGVTGVTAVVAGDLTFTV